MPRAFQAALNDSSTPFEFLGAEFTIQGDEVNFSSLVLKNSQYLIEGDGTVDFQHNVNFEAQLILLEDVSRFLMGRVKELSLLTNPQGRVVIPFVYRGLWPAVRPRPDFGYLAERLVQQGTTGAAGLVEKGLEVLNQLTGTRSPKTV